MIYTKKIERGFTLLELLVAVAIIAILTVVILAALNSSRGKSTDATIKQNLTNARSQIELFYSNQGTYNGVCNDSSTGAFKQIQAAKRAYGGSPKAVYDDGATAATWNTEQCNDSGTAYAIWIPLAASTAGSPQGWCVDNLNRARVSVTPLSAVGTVCP